MNTLKWETLCNKDEIRLYIIGDNEPPFISGSPRTINRISRGLNRQGVKHSVDGTKEPEILILSLKDYCDMAYLWSVLDQIGRQTPAQIPYRTTIPGRQIAVEEFEMGAWAAELLKNRCDEYDVDISEYDIVIRLEPKKSHKY